MTLLFVFDMDNVLYDYDWRERMRLLGEVTGHDLGELRRRWWNDAGEWRAERGGYDADAYLAAFVDAMGVPVSEEEWVRMRAAAMSPWSDSIDVVRRAAELGRVTLLTNNNALTGRHLDVLAPELVDVFGDHRFTSAHYGARKPEPLVFERVLAAYGAEAADTFFADDMPGNVAGAASIGITAHVFTDAASMRAAVEEFAAARLSTTAG